MKNLFILTCLLAIFTSNLQAQGFKGRKVVGLSLGAYDTENDYSHHFAWDIAPSIGYFINNRWSIGLKARFYGDHFSSRGSQINNLSTTNNKRWGFGAFASHYHWFAPRWAFVVDSELGYEHNQRNYTHHNTLENSVSTTKSFMLNMRMGALFQINKRFSVDISSNLFSLALGKEKQRTNTIGQDNATEQTYTHFRSSFLGGISPVPAKLRIGLRYFFK